MSRVESAVVVDAEGLSFRARLEPAEGGAQVLLELGDGAQFLVPAELLVPRADGRFDLRLRLREYAAQTGQAELEPGLEALATTSDAETNTSAAYETAPGDEVMSGALADEAAVISLAEETLQVGKRTVERGRVRLHKTVSERLETAELTLMREEVEVERVPVNRPVDEAEPVRYEGEVMVIPRYEEVLVVSKQLVLVEELRVRTVRSERREPQQVTLRREELSVERGEGSDADPDADPDADLEA